LASLMSAQSSGLSALQRRHWYSIVVTRHRPGRIAGHRRTGASSRSSQDTASIASFRSPRRPREGVELIGRDWLRGRAAGEPGDRPAAATAVPFGDPPTARSEREDSARCGGRRRDGRETTSNPPRNRGRSPGRAVNPPRIGAVQRVASVSRPTAPAGQRTRRARRFAGSVF
jgi:hypothetical protein